jgi:formylmethanofuran:tetrahydromethanopterin formyltransferase
MSGIQAGDTFAAAFAKKLSAALVTRDKEMKTPEEAGEFSVLWLN